MQLALDHPGLVRSLLVLDIAPSAYAPRHEKIIAGMLSLRLSGAQNRKEIEDALAPWIPDLATRRFLLKNLTRATEGFQWRMGLQEIANGYGRLSGAIEDREPFAGPTLFLRGEDSNYLTPGDLPAIRRLFPAAELKAVEHAGHWLQVDNPERLLQLTLEFLQRRGA